MLTGISNSRHGLEKWILHHLNVFVKAEGKNHFSLNRKL